MQFEDPMDWTGEITEATLAAGEYLDGDVCVEGDGGTVDNGGQTYVPPPPPPQG